MSLIGNKTLFASLLFLSASQITTAQSALDNYLLFNLGIVESHSAVKNQKVKSSIAEYLDSNQKVIFIVEKKYDPVGRIIRWARYPDTLRQDSLVGDFSWKGDTVDAVVSISSFDRLKMPSDKDSKPMIRELTLAKKRFTTRRFWREGDTTVAICDGKISCLQPLRTFYMYNGPRDVDSYTNLDSTKINFIDTTVSERREGDAVNYTIERDYFIDLGKRKVKREYMRFKADTLVVLEMDEKTLDAFGREISYKEIYGIHQRVNLCVNTFFDDQNFITRVERDYYPVTGSPDFTWTYNKYGNLIKSETFSELYKSHVVTDILYVQPGIIEKVETRRNGVLISQERYQYSYY
jgi:hypothetical protein